MPPKNEKPNNSQANQEPKIANKTNEIATQQIKASAPAAPQKSGSGFSTTVAVFAFGLAAAACYGSYWNYQQTQAEKNASAETIASLQQQLKTELDKSGLHSQSGKMGDMEFSFIGPW